jgi:hypothetical protein
VSAWCDSTTSGRLEAASASVPVQPRQDRFALSFLQTRRSGIHGWGRLNPSCDPSRREAWKPVAVATATGAAASHSFMPESCTYASASPPQRQQSSRLPIPSRRARGRRHRRACREWRRARALIETGVEATSVAHVLHVRVSRSLPRRDLRPLCPDPSGLSMGMQRRKRDRDHDD